MWCNNPACDFGFDESKEKTPMSCPKCKRSSFSRPKGWDPIRHRLLGFVPFPGQPFGCGVYVYERWMEL
jgi:hypothetical protein